MASAKKSVPKKKPAARSRASSSAKKRKYVLPAVETTALEKSLEPGEPGKKSRSKKKKRTKQPFVMPGYIAFTLEVWRTMWKFKSTFWRLVLVYAALSGLFVGLASQAIYTQLSGLIREAGGEVVGGDISKLGEAGDLLLISLTGAANPEVGEAQQLIGGLLVLLMWLTTIWLLRAFLAGHTPRLRDGFYNSGAPLVPTLLLSFVFILQLLPAAIAAIGVAAAVPTGFVNGVIIMVPFWIIIALLIILSLYWITSTFIALVVVTLPGMYPGEALKSARELVAGRRLPILLRMLWLFVISGLLWVVIMIPIILLDAALKGLWQAIEWLPIVPVAFLLVSSLALVWMVSYVYLLYRKVVDNDAATA